MITIRCTKLGHWIIYASGVKAGVVLRLDEGCYVAESLTGMRGEGVSAFQAARSAMRRRPMAVDAREIVAPVLSAPRGRLELVR
jgi:hypothetical protein